MSSEYVRRPGTLALKRKGASAASAVGSGDAPAVKRGRRDDKEFGDDVQTTAARKSERVTGGGAAEKRMLKFTQGVGRVTSNGETLQGFDTTFKTDLSPGDTIGVNHPRTLMFEERKIVQVLSQRTATLDDGFSSELVSTTTFYVKKDSAKIREVAAAKLKAGGRTQIPEREMDDAMTDQVKAGLLKKQTSRLPIREKTGMWGYKLRVETVDSHTAEELLDMRIRKVGRDKYC